MQQSPYKSGKYRAGKFNHPPDRSSHGNIPLPAIDLFCNKGTA